ncbi:MFS transporter [Rhodospirillum rubrum]|uniref:MFS transporter n=1 Tax=Rhodospirillum rubrum TaxID=1085 RepID=UPI001908A83A|nr:MFS transporter [Rhodospirillum rubrum]MBK1665222.1 MFS transporter [Rhodospirillum rubrum]MBK1676926.1 MFS transporter [Rhodospirillum rubrum]
MTKRQGLALVVIVLLALNLRPVMAGLGPLLDIIEHATGISSAGAGMLTTLPIFLMGLGAFAGRRIRRLFGERRGGALGIALVALACASRLAWNDKTGMFLTAATAGLGIAIVQGLVPGIIKQWFGAATGRAMGLYTTGIMGGAALAAATAAGLSRLIGWQATLAIWSLPALFALVCWLVVPAPETPARPNQDHTHKSFWRSRRAWLLMLFFGIGTGAYTLVLAWLPPFYMGLGQSRDMSGYLLAGLTLAEVVAGLGVSTLIGRFPDRRGPLIAVLLCLLIGLACLILAPVSLALAAIPLIGVGIGALFPLSLIITLDHADDPAVAGDLAAFVQGGGYMIASAMPFIAGLIRDRFADLSQAWGLMAAGVVVLIAMALRFSPTSARKMSRSPTKPSGVGALHPP